MKIIQLDEEYIVPDKKTRSRGHILRSKGIRKTSKSSVTPYKKKLWELCKQIIRLRYGNVCFTCGKGNLSGGGWQTGHFIPSASGGAFLRYDLRNLRPQCYFCNVNCGGSGAQYYKKLVETEGQEYVDQIFKDKNITIKADIEWYTNKIQDYERIYMHELSQKNKGNL